MKSKEYDMVIGNGFGFPNFMTFDHAESSSFDLRVYISFVEEEEESVHFELWHYARI